MAVLQIIILDIPHKSDLHTHSIITTLKSKSDPNGWLQGPCRIREGRSPFHTQLYHEIKNLFYTSQTYLHIQSTQLWSQNLVLMAVLKSINLDSPHKSDLYTHSILTTLKPKSGPYDHPWIYQPSSSTQIWPTYIYNPQPWSQILVLRADPQSINLASPHKSNLPTHSILTTLKPNLNPNGRPQGLSWIQEGRSPFHTQLYHEIKTPTLYKLYLTTHSIHTTLKPKCGPYGRPSIYQPS